MLPTVTVVIPVKDPGELLNELLESLFDLDYDHNLLEIIVIDDCSDVPVHLVLPDQSIRAHLVRVPKNVGYYACANMGIKSAQGDIFVRCDHDTFPDRHFLKRAVDTLAFSSNAAGVRCLVSTNSAGLLPPLYFAPVGMHLLVYRRQPLERIGGFDPRFRSRGDSDVELRFIELGFKIMDCPESKLFHPLRKLTLSTLLDYARRRQYDSLLLAKHPHCDKRVLGGLLTKPRYGNLSFAGISAIGGVVAIAFLLGLGVPIADILMLLGLVYLCFHLTTTLWLCLSRKNVAIGASDAIEYPAKSLLFVVAVLIGRMLGSVRYRRLTI